MATDRLIAALRDLKQQGLEDALVQASTPQHATWKAKVDSTIGHALGEDSSILKEFRDVSYYIGVYSGAPGEAEEDARYFRAAVQEATGLIDAAIYALDLQSDTRAAQPSAYDAELWGHVKHSVEEQRWEQVASAAVIFTEDKVRRWAGRHVAVSGKSLFGQALFGKALGADGPLALGKQTNETEGWRNLGLGLVAAIGNVDRHHIQARDDAQQYALGVLGLASLLLTQIRHEHPDKTADVIAP